MPDPVFAVDDALAASAAPSFSPAGEEARRYEIPIPNLLTSPPAIVERNGLAVTRFIVVAAAMSGAAQAHSHVTVGAEMLLLGTMIAGYALASSFPRLQTCFALSTWLEEAAKGAAVFLLLGLVSLAVPLPLFRLDHRSQGYLIQAAWRIVAVGYVTHVLVVTACALVLQYGWTRFLTSVAVIGEGAHAAAAMAYLRKTPLVRLVGFCDCSPSPGGASLDGARYLGTADELELIFRRQRVDAAIIALPWRDDRIRMLVTQLRRLPVDVRIMIEIPRLPVDVTSLCALGNLPMLGVSCDPLSKGAKLAKRVEDLVLASLLTVASLPLLALIAMCIKLDSPGPLLFRQLRVGYAGQVFEILKFRTMFVEQTDQAAEKLTCPNDPRVTRIGRILRRLSFDELPQLFNVLAGDMSVVGPRPHALKAKAGGLLYHEAIAEYDARLRVRPGITGWAQIHGWRGETETVEKIAMRVQHDLFYIENWSLLLDLRILIGTMLILFRQQNAY